MTIKTVPTVPLLWCTMSISAFLETPPQPTAGNQIESFLGAVVIIGLLSMVVIQMAKDFFPLRGLFQSAWIRKWIHRRAMHRAIDAWTVEKDLIRLAAADEERTEDIYNLPVEQLCGQINAALQAAIENPPYHKDLIAVFASTANDEDLAVFLGPRPSLVVSENAPDDVRMKIDAYAQARNRVAHHVERAVDSLQIAISSRWKLLLQMTAVALSLGLAWLGVGRYWKMTGWAAVRDVLAVGLIAGYLSSVARDILARIQQGTRP